jgi:DNA repair exonuclease SbcCD nuclease subunit
MARTAAHPAPAPSPPEAVSRRELLRRAAAVAVAGATASALGACGAASAGGGGGASTRIVTIGDWGTGGRAARDVAAGVRRVARAEHVDVLLTVGDNDYSNSPERFEERWRREYGWVRPAGIHVAGVLGNHDVETGDGRYEFRTLGMPGRYYRRRFGLVDLFALDSNDVDGRQTRWLEQVLAASTNRWKIAAFHHPLHTCGRYEGRHFRVTKWAELFERHGVQLVLNGHDHNYQRFEDGPVTYVVVGGGGASLYGLQDCPESGAVALAGEAVHSFLVIEASEKRIAGRTLAADGRPIDRFTVV